MADKRKAANDSAMKKRNQSYTIDYKLQAVAFVKEGNSKESAARKFGVDSKRIREWCQQEDKLKSSAASPKTSSRRRLDGGGRRPLLETLELELYEWIEHQRSQRLPVTRKMVRKEATLRLANNGGDGLFVASEGWLRNFFRRCGITLRHRTTVGQHIPDKVSAKVMS